MNFADICVVIVTYNRLEKLKRTIKSYEKQTLLPKYIIIVNNASTDETKDYLEKWKNVNNGINKIIINSEQNLGGSGGFYLGEQLAITLDSSWVMVGDDDAYPDKFYIEKAFDIINNKKRNEISVICGLVKQNGNFDNYHRANINSKWKINFTKKINFNDIKADNFYIEISSYVGPIINIEILKKVGLINEKFFIWYDDVEHMIRLGKKGKIICSKNMIIEHDIEKKRESLNWKYYYGFRNYIYMIKKHYPNQYIYILLLFFIKAILCPLRGKSLKEVKMRLIAMRDAFYNKLGKHDIYKPGWK